MREIQSWSVWYEKVSEIDMDKYTISRSVPMCLG